jgi:hypothetical protein
MNRRAFLSGAAALLAAPLAAEAQQVGKGWRIGYLVPGPAACPATKSIRAFRQGLLDAGFSEGRDITIDRRCYPTDAVARKIPRRTTPGKSQRSRSGRHRSSGDEGRKGDPGRLWQRTRPRWGWTRAQPGPTWDEHDRDHRPFARAGRETGGDPEGSLAERSPCRNTRCVG